MKTCRKCGASMADTAKFCTICGTPAEEEQAKTQKAEERTQSAYARSSETRNAGQQNDTYGGMNSGSQGQTYQNQSYQNSGSQGYQNQAYQNQSYQQNYGGQGYQNNQGYGQDYYSPYGMRPRTSGIAVAALVFGLVGIFLGYLGAALAVLSVVNASWMILAILLYAPSALGVILGIAGIAKTGDGVTKGRGLAIAGLVLGILFLVIWGIAAAIAREAADYATYGLYSLFS